MTSAALRLANTPAPCPTVARLLAQVRPTGGRWPAADWEALRPGKRDAVVWCHHGAPDAATPWYALNESRIVRATPATLDPRWWRAQLGRVALRLDLYPAGIHRKGALRERVRLVDLAVDDDERPLVEPAPFVVVELPDGTHARAALGPLSYDDGVPVYHPVPGAWFPREVAP